MTDRAITYARVSGDDRRKEGRNLAGQLDMGRNYCEEHGYILLAEMAEDDRGASGASFELEKLNRIRELAHNGEFEVLVVREIDRLSRNLAKQLIVEEELRRCGVRIEYVIGEYPDTPEGNLNKNIKASIAEYERLKIRERVMRGRINKVKSGGLVAHGRAPYGYRLQKEADKWSLVVYEPEAEIVRLMFQWYIEGDGIEGPMGGIQIAKKLTSMGVPTSLDNLRKESVEKGKPQKFGKKTRGAAEWSAGSIFHMLTNRTYIGIWQYGKRGVGGDGKRQNNPESHLVSLEVPPIVSPEQFEAAQARRMANRKDSKRNTKYQYLLGKLVYCGDCGSRMASKSHKSAGRVYFYYLCRAHDEYAVDCANTALFPAGNVDYQVWEWVENILTNPDELEEGLEEYRAKREEENAPVRERLGVLDDLLADNQSQLERLLDLYLSGGFDKNLLIERKNRLEETVSSLQRERAALLARLEAHSLRPDQVRTIKEFAAKIAAGIDEARKDFGARRAIIEALDMHVSLIREGDTMIAHVSCVLGDEVLCLDSKRSYTPRGDKRAIFNFCNF